MPRSRSSGALSIWSKATYLEPPALASTLVIAAVSVVLPWSMCPIVPTFTCGLFRTNFCFPIAHYLLKIPARADRFSTAPLRQVSSSCYPLRRARLACASRLTLDFLGQVFRHFLVVRELHGIRGAPACHRPQVVDIAEHLGQRHMRPQHLRAAALLRA